MSNPEDKATTVIIRRPSKVTMDDRGRTVWQGEIEEVALELMSTQELKVALAAADDTSKESIAAIAAGDKEGVLARDPSGSFDVVTQAELADLRMRGNMPASIAGRLDEKLVPAVDNDGEELSLVSTQALRRILNPDAADEPESEADEGGGFNPYDHS